jgi:ribosomal protein S18 acetylase RimI-like enzyme
MGYVMTVSGEPDDPVIVAAVKARPTVEISKIYVRASAHGSGIAQRLMSVAVEEAKALGAQSVWLGVNQHNERANSFYERSGFLVVGERRFQVGDSLEEDFVRENVL